ncbi:hypothetical protein [uncultured Wocania sp.]|uniref:hypothetical protein n=1 Tax=uncultured Wocania sp. TaxID=2834404 RepID=UPI0030F75564
MIKIEDKTVKLYVDCPSWKAPIKVDDFLIYVGKTKSNSVYHVAKVKYNPKPEKRIFRYHVEVYKSNLITPMYKKSLLDLT